MKEYVALWHIGDVSRGEIVRMDDKTAERFLKLGAIRPIEGDARPAKKPKAEPKKQPEKEPDKEPEEPEETEPEAAEEPATEEEDEPEEPEIDALDAIGEIEPEPVKPARKTQRRRGKV